MKNTVDYEMALLDMDKVITDLNNYAGMRLMNVNDKQLDGMTPEDFVSDSIIKILTGVRKWDTAITNDFRKFLFGCVRSEVSNFLKKIGRRNFSVVSIDEEKYDFDPADTITYTKESIFEGE